MKERPILFSGSMVRAILDGRKTMTRRIVKPQPVGNPWLWDGDEVDPEPGWFDSYETGRLPCGANEREVNEPMRCPYGVPGDHLYVRETWNTSARCLPPISEPYIYAADLNSDGVMKWAATWKPSIHMPRDASRVTLEVTGVRVERLQSIDVDDAFAEGCPDDAAYPLDWYRDLWDSLNAPRGYGWDANPYVWVVEFKRIEA